MKFHTYSTEIGTVVSCMITFSEPRVVRARSNQRNEYHPGVLLLKRSKQRRVIHVTNAERTSGSAVCLQGWYRGRPSRPFLG